MPRLKTLLIRKLFRENACGCSARCSHSIHGQFVPRRAAAGSARAGSRADDHDFGLPQGDVRDLIDAFDHAVTLVGRRPCYVESMRRHSERWVLLPVSPSAEQFSRVFFRLVDAALSGTHDERRSRRCGCIRSSFTRPRPVTRSAFATMRSTRAWAASTGRHRVRAGHRRTVARSGPVRAYQARPPHFGRNPDDQKEPARRPAADPPSLRRSDRHSVRKP